LTNGAALEPTTSLYSRFSITTTTTCDVRSRAIEAGLGMASAAREDDDCPHPVKTNATTRTGTRRARESRTGRS
jgi:hypothetical protein